MPCQNDPLSVLLEHLYFAQNTAQKVNRELHLAIYVQAEETLLAVHQVSNEVNAHSYINQVSGTQIISPQDNTTDEVRNYSNVSPNGTISSDLI